MLRSASLTLFGTLLSMLPAHAQVRVWQDSITLPTYAEGDPDPLPQFAAFDVNNPANYPYPFRSRISIQSQDRSQAAWRTLNIENEYLFCRVLPDLGGHLYNCRDKLTGREVFHVASVVKKAMIGQRGAWISTGIESNFPVTHSRTSVSPVNFAILTHPDGAASIFISDTDRLTGMQWRVEFRLEPGVAMLQQRVSLYNPTPERKPYMWWSNAAIERDDPSLRFVLPAHVVVSHGRTAMETWPVTSAGVDISRLENDPTENTWFAYQSHEPFMAVYKPRFRSGVAHFADPSVVEGKKLWFMGTNELDSYRQRLTDGGNLYVELQAGLFADQDAYEFLGPEQSRIFTEYWIPFRNLSGITRATPDLLLYTAPSASSPLTVELTATRAIAGARIRILSGGQSVSQTTADLDPKTVWKGSAPPGARPPFVVEVSDPSGRVLLRHQEAPYDAGGPAGVPIGPRKKVDWNASESDAFLLKRGEYNETLNQTPFARSDYELGQRRFPLDRNFDKAAGRLDLSLGRFEDALTMLMRAMGVASLDPETVYYNGVAASLNSRDQVAQSFFSQLTASSEFAPAAILEMAFLAARSGDIQRALSLTAPLEADPGRGARLAGIRAALLRHAGRGDAALAEITRGLAWAPEDSFLRYEAALAGRQDEALWSYLAGDAERVLNIVDEYIRLALWEDALACLSHPYAKADPHFIEPGSVLPQASALVAYYRAYCKIVLKQDPAEDLRAASKSGTRYQFPSRVSSYRVLRAAVAQNPSDATAQALLGDLLMYALRTEDAAEAWQRAVTLNPQFEIERMEVARARQILVSTVKSPAPPGAALATKPEPPPAPAVLATKTPAAATPTQLALQAMIRSASDRAPQDELAIFHDQSFAAEKQPPEIRQAYVEVQLQVLLAVSTTGKCQDIDDLIETLGLEDKSLAFTLYGFQKWTKAAHFQYYLGVAEANCGRDKNARRYFARAAKLKESPSSPDFVYPLLASFRMNPEQAKTSVAEREHALQEIGAQDLRMFAQALLSRISGQEGRSQPDLGQVARVTRDPLIQYLASVELSRKP